MGTTTLTIRIDEKTKNRLEKLAQATDRTMSYLVSSTIERILDEEEWQIGEIRKRVRIANSPDAAFVSHEEIEAWLKSWGTEEETEPPKCK
ncbi:MAG: CopG family ribbon-helix-helix protein [Nitrospirota bacterium]